MIGRTRDKSSLSAHAPRTLSPLRGFTSRVAQSPGANAPGYVLSALRACERSFAASLAAKRRQRGACVKALLPMLTCVALFTATALAQDQTNEEKPDTLDDTLLDELGGDGLLDGLDDIPVDPAFKNKEDNSLIDPKDQKLLDELGDGEDIELGGEDELTRIARQMRQVQRRMEGKEVSRQTQELQERIVADLDALIKQLQQQKKNSSPSSSSSPQQPRDQDVQQPDQQPDAGQEKPSNKPSQQSTERLGRQSPGDIDAAAMEALVKRVWGHLPDRARQELQNASNEEFLPKYQQVIEEYFRRLAEETR